MFRYNGLVNTKAVGVTPGPNNKGFVLTTKKVKAANRPGKTLVKVTMKAGSRRSLHKVSEVTFYISAGRTDHDLHMVFKPVLRIRFIFCGSWYCPE